MVFHISQGWWPICIQSYRLGAVSYMTMKFVDLSFLHFFYIFLYFFPTVLFFSQYETSTFHIFIFWSSKRSGTGVRLVDIQTDWPTNGSWAARRPVFLRRSWSLESFFETWKIYGWTMFQLSVKLLIQHEISSYFLNKINSLNHLNNLLDISRQNKGWIQGPTGADGLRVELGQFPQAKVVRRSDWGWAICNSNVVCCDVAFKGGDQWWSGGLAQTLSIWIHCYEWSDASITVKVSIK